MENTYICAIIGAIGAGKSEVCTRVRKALPEAKYIPEYIDHPDPQERAIAQRMLSSYLSGAISDWDFQYYIQNYYITNGAPNEHGVTILERTMSDSVSIFCNLAHKNGKLDDRALSLFFMTCSAADERSGTPCFFLGNFEFSRVDSTPEIEVVMAEIMKIIENDMKTGVRCRVIGLDCTPDVARDRIIRRSRPDEAEKYDDSYTRLNTRMYSNLYDLLEKNGKISITQLDKLFD